MSTSPVDDWCITELKPIKSKWIIKPFMIEPFVKTKSNQFNCHDVHGNKFSWALMLTLDSEACFNICIQLASTHKNLCASVSYSILNEKGEKLYTNSTAKEVLHGENSMHTMSFINKQKLLYGRSAMVPKNTLIILCEIYTNISVVNTMKSPSVKQPNTERNLLNDFAKLYEAKKFCDVILKLSDGKEIKAHKAILSARSAVFAAMFEHEMMENKENSVTISDMDSNVCEEMIRYIYTGEVTNISDLVEELVDVADKYDLNDLKNMCENELISDIDIDNVDSLISLADRYRLDNLKKEIIQFFVTNTNNFVKSNEFKKLFAKYPDLLSEVFLAKVGN